MEWCCETANRQGNLISTIISTAEYPAIDFYAIESSFRILLACRRSRVIVILQSD